MLRAKMVNSGLIPGKEKQLQALVFKANCLTFSVKRHCETSPYEVDTEGSTTTDRRLALMLAVSLWQSLDLVRTLNK